MVVFGRKTATRYGNPIEMSLDPATFIPYESHKSELRDRHGDSVQFNHWRRGIVIVLRADEVPLAQCACCLQTRGREWDRDFSEV